MKSLYKSKIIWISLIVVFVLGFLIGNSGNNKQIIHEHSEEESGLWTCSMHPQIKMENPGQCPICFMDLIPLVQSDESTSPNQISLSEAAIKLAEIQTSKVNRKQAFIDIVLAGKIELNEKKTYMISSDVNGRIENMEVDFVGEKVKKGSLLYKIYSPEIFAIQEELIQQKKAYEQSSSTINLNALAGIREKLQLLGLTKKQVRDIENSGKARETVSIFAESDGTVLNKLKNVGDYVKVGEPVYKISDMTKLWLQLDVYENQVNFIAKGQDVGFTVKSFPGLSFKGIVDFVDPVIDTQNQSVKIRVLVDNSDTKLKPGNFVKANIKVALDNKGNPILKNQKSTDPLLVPETAPLITGKRAVVFVKIDSDEKVVFESREVQLGAKVGDQYIVLSGLDEGEEVVTKGNFKIDSAMQLEGKFSMMSIQDEKPVQKSMNLDAFIPLYNEYFKLQEALANDDFNMSKTHYKNLFKELSAIKVDHSQLEHDQMLKWMAVKKNLLDIQLLDFTDVEVLRSNFEIVSDNLIDMAKSFGNIGNLKFNEAYCPMAFGNKGAYWLQKGDKVFNPYFGAKMLHCGSIETKFEPGK